MSKHYEAPPEVRPLEKLIRDFSYHNGFELRKVFDDFLIFIIHGYSPGLPPLDTWKYKKEQTAVFYEMYRQWVFIMEKQIKIHGWYDAFGDLYMSLITSKSGQSAKGQFFTPDHICDLMKDIIMAGALKDAKVTIMDPTCGSGRTLLAAHAQDPTAYHCAEDIDQTCCMMTVCNFLIHGVRGEVIWHNSLQPETYWKGWRTNYLTAFLKFPYIEIIPKVWSRIWCRWEQRRLEVK